ncbi:MAG: phage tail tube protein [Methylobacter sp.]
MSTITKMTNVAIALQSALGVAKTITGITKAAPGVVTATHDFANGDYVVLSVQGMQQLDGKVYRVCSVSTTVSFQLEDVTAGTGIDTTLFDTFSSGTAKKITFGTSLSTVAEISMSGGDFAKVDTSVIHANVKREIPGLASPVSIDIKHLWDITDAGQLAMKASSDAQTQLAIKVTFGVGGKVMVFNGYVGFTALPAGAFGEALKSSGSISATNAPTYYSA